MPGTPALRAWWAGRAPAAGAAVMATGILSTDLHPTGDEGLSLAAPAPAGVIWIALAVGFVRRLVTDPRRWAAEARSPGALTAVAATAVLAGSCRGSNRNRARA
ncbi:hypothetical protein ACIRU5_07320 [Streptomyces misionensis]|uniref:hypothetical protein n=1 Tax=Streptomyces misionensis TaxID=67331 RepID=UPI003829B5C9